MRVIASTEQRQQNLLTLSVTREENTVVELITASASLCVKDWLCVCVCRRASRVRGAKFRPWEGSQVPVLPILLSMPSSASSLPEFR